MAEKKPWNLHEYGHILNFFGDINPSKYFSLIESSLEIARDQEWGSNSYNSILTTFSKIHPDKHSRVIRGALKLFEGCSQKVEDYTDILTTLSKISPDKQDFIIDSIKKIESIYLNSVFSEQDKTIKELLDIFSKGNGNYYSNKTIYSGLALAFETMSTEKQQGVIDAIAALSDPKFAGKDYLSIVNSLQNVSEHTYSHLVQTVKDLMINEDSIDTVGLVSSLANISEEKYEHIINFMRKFNSIEKQKINKNDRGFSFRNEDKEYHSLCIINDLGKKETDIYPLILNVLSHVPEGQWTLKDYSIFIRYMTSLPMSEYDKAINLIQEMPPRAEWEIQDYR
jgi:hypothetical protein